MSPLPRYAVVLNVPTVVMMTVKAETEREACEQALAQFLARPRLFQRQELGQPAILSCQPLSTSEAAT